jgi:hypothetical protein
MFFLGCNFIVVAVFHTTMLVVDELRYSNDLAE